MDALRPLTEAILAGDDARVEQLLAAHPDWATMRYEAGATRQEAARWLLPAIHRYLITGDIALHLAAAAYRTSIVERLIARGADVHARNRHGDTPLQAAATGAPGSAHWNPEAQCATIGGLIGAGADPNARNKRGVTPLHVAVRTRCAAAVERLIALGADAALPNGSGSTPLLLARLNTGKSGSGSAEAKAQQQAILSLLGSQ